MGETAPFTARISLAWLTTPPRCVFVGIWIVPLPMIWSYISFHQNITTTLYLFLSSLLYDGVLLLLLLVLLLGMQVSHCVVPSNVVAWISKRSEFTIFIQHPLVLSKQISLRHFLHSISLVLPPCRSLAASWSLIHCLFIPPPHHHHLSNYYNASPFLCANQMSFHAFRVKLHSSTFRHLIICLAAHNNNN